MGEDANNYVFNRALPDSSMRPDAVDFENNIVRELKPNTPSGIRLGRQQLLQYQSYLEDYTGEPFRTYLDLYEP